MRAEIENWLKQAESDYSKAKVLLDNNYFDGVAFYSHQATEKALKALFLAKLKESERSHSLVYLSKKLNVPKNMLSGIRDLNPEYVIFRYPDIASGVPAENYDEEIVQRHINTANEVIQWVKEQMSGLEDSSAGSTNDTE